MVHCCALLVGRAHCCLAVFLLPCNVALDAVICDAAGRDVGHPSCGPKWEQYTILFIHFPAPGMGKEATWTALHKRLEHTACTGFTPYMYQAKPWMAKPSCFSTAFQPSTQNVGSFRRCAIGGAQYLANRELVLSLFFFDLTSV